MLGRLYGSAIRAIQAGAVIDGQWGADVIHGVRAALCGSPAARAMIALRSLVACPYAASPGRADQCVLVMTPAHRVEAMCPDDHGRAYSPAAPERATP
jgi:hypothetical protein